MKGNNIDWSKIDWSQSNEEIARATGFAESTISYRRRGYHERHSKRPKYWIDWSGADWTKSNVTLSAYYQCTPQAAACARRIHAPADLKISPSSITRKKRMQAIMDERIARAKSIVKQQAADKREPAPAPSGFLDRVFRFIGLSIN